jgi:hypothetical protein
MTSPNGCSSWLLIALVLAAITCLVNDVWVAPFKPFYAWRLFLVLLIMMAAIKCFTGI